MALFVDVTNNNDDWAMAMGGLVDFFPLSESGLITVWRRICQTVKKKKAKKKKLTKRQGKLSKRENVISSEYDIKEASRVEAVTAFLWKRFVDFGKAKIGGKTTFAALHALNLRPGVKPPCPEHTFGNLWRFILAFSSSNPSTTTEYEDLIIQLRNGITKVNIECLEYTQNKEKNLDYIMRSLGLFSKGEMDLCIFSSWCGFPIYEVDFGWGKPRWVSTTAIPFKNAVILMPTRSGDGIEALANMVEDEFEMLQHDEEFISVLVRA